MRFIFLVLFMLFLDIYVFQAVKYKSAGFTPEWKTTIHSIYWLLSGMAILFVFNGGNIPFFKMGKTMEILTRAFIFIFYFSKFFMVFFLLMDDIRRLFSFSFHKISGSGHFNPGRKEFMTNLSIIMGGLPLATLSYGIIRNSYRYKVYRPEILMDNLPQALDGLKIIQISDIHAGSFFFKEPIKNAIELINAEKPDLVFFTGDMVNSRADEMEPYMDIFSEIKARFGVFSVLGNHDYGDYHRWSSSVEKEANGIRFEAIQKEMGWDLLRNEHRLLDINGEKVAIIGIENMSALPQFHKYGDVSKATAGLPVTSLQLLLSHDPSYWQKGILNKHPEIDITFSGHTHGFQFGIEIPGIFRWSPSQYVYKQWAGLYEEDGQYLYVNRGLGFLGYPGRVGILPEITSMTLHAGRKPSDS